MSKYPQRIVWVCYKARVLQTDRQNYDSQDRASIAARAVKMELTWTHAKTCTALWNNFVASKKANSGHYKTRSTLHLETCRDKTCRCRCPFCRLFKSHFSQNCNIRRLALSLTVPNWTTYGEVISGNHRRFALLYWIFDKRNDSKNHLKITDLLATKI